MFVPDSHDAGNHTDGCARACGFPEDTGTANCTPAIVGSAASVPRDWLTGTTPVAFPGGHGGFLPAGGPYGGEPDAFAGILRKVLSD